MGVLTRHVHIEENGVFMINTTYPESSLVAALVPDSATPPRLLYFEGYPGSSSRRGYVRFYLSFLLDEFYDFPHPSVRHVVALPTSRLPFGGSAIWVDRAVLEAAPERPVYYIQGESQNPISLEELQDLGKGSAGKEAQPNGQNGQNRAAGPRNDGSGGGDVPAGVAFNSPTGMA
jgi:hypothetical protein